MVTSTTHAIEHDESSEAVRSRTKVGILLVDDDATKRFALRSILAPLDEEIVEASSGADALRQLLRREFAVVLLDVRMPIMDGFETAQLIRQRPRSELTPIIFVTALDQAETDMGRGYTLGAVDFVFAPVVPAILRAKVAVFVELYRAQQDLRRYRKQLETLVQERTVALTAINRELEAFSASISNDLRAPLLAFDAMSKTLLEQYGDRLDAKALRQLRKMSEATRRMTTVFDGLQMLFHLTSGEIHREDVDVSALAANMITGVRKEDPERPADIEVAPGIVVNADKRLVRILIASLIDNAWKFSATKPRTRIVVGQETVDGQTRVFVKDNGVGFDMIETHRMFGAFQRLHSESEFAGSGMGLATARRIVNRHGGRIWAEGAVGEGATVYFTL